MNERILKPTARKDGYLRVSLCKGGIKKSYLLHKLVAETFIDNSGNKAQINHIDGNKFNNTTKNLEYCTQSENIKHAYKNGLMKPRYGIDNPNITVIEQYDINNNFIKEWVGVKETEKILKINNISVCCSGKRKTAGGYIWKYKNT